MKSLRKGIGNKKDIEKYYDNWSSSYDETLYKWNYKAPLQSVKILKKYIKTKPKFILDLACGTGLFVDKFLQIYPDCICCLLYTSPSPRDRTRSRMPSSA